MAAKQGTPQPMSLQLVVKVIYGYVVVFSLLIPTLAFYFFPSAEGTERSFAVNELFPDMTSPINIGLYACALATLFLGFSLPKIIGAKGTASIVSAMAAGQVKNTDPTAQAFSPYVIRLVCFEFTTICGLVFAVLSQTPQHVIPLATLGLLGIIMSPPRRSLLDALANNLSTQQPGIVR